MERDCQPPGYRTTSIPLRNTTSRCKWFVQPINERSSRTSNIDKNSPDPVVVHFPSIQTQLPSNRREHMTWHGSSLVPCCWGRYHVDPQARNPNIRAGTTLVGPSGGKGTHDTAPREPPTRTMVRIADIPRYLAVVVNVKVASPPSKIARQTERTQHADLPSPGGPFSWAGRRLRYRCF